MLLTYLLVIAITYLEPSAHYSINPFTMLQVVLPHVGVLSTIDMGEDTTIPVGLVVVFPCTLMLVAIRIEYVTFLPLGTDHFFTDIRYLKLSGHPYPLLSAHSSTI